MTTIVSSRKNIIPIGVYLSFTFMISSTVIPSYAQTTPLEPAEPPPLPPATSLLFPELYVSWEGSGGEQIDKPIQLRGMQSGERSLMTEDYDLPGSENNLAIKSYPRVPQGANFAITTTVQDSAKEVNIQNVTIRPILSQDPDGKVEMGNRIPLTPITIDEDTKGYSLSNQDLGEYVLQVFVLGKESSVLGGYETRLQIIPAGTMQTAETEGDAVPSTEESETATPTTTEETDHSVAANFLTYENPTMGIRIQYPVGWYIEDDDDEATFVQQEDIVSFETTVGPQDYSTLSEHASNRVSKLKDERQDFKLLESTPTTISGNYPAHKLVYTFVKDGGPRDGETNKVMRIWAFEDNKLYTVAYISELDKFSDYLPVAQNMIDSFRILGNGGPVDDMRPVSEGLPTNQLTEELVEQEGGVSVDTGPDESTSADEEDEATNQLADRYYEGLDWRGVCNNPLLGSYVSQPCNVLVTSDGNALTSEGKVQLEGILCKQGPSIISTLETFYGTISDNLKNELRAACGW